MTDSGSNPMRCKVGWTPYDYPTVQSRLIADAMARWSFTDIDDQFALYINAINSKRNILPSNHVIYYLHC